MVGVSDFLMTSLAKLTVKIGSGVAGVVSESEVGLIVTPMVMHLLSHVWSLFVTMVPVCHQMVRDMAVSPHAVEAWKVTKSSLKGAA